MERNYEREDFLKKALSSINFACFKFEPFAFDSITSTQDFLAKEIKSSREGDFVTSRIQTKGKGREGREWVSDSGGLYLSLTLVPRLDIVDKIASMATGAVIDALDNFSLGGCYQKPPNDVFCNARKIAGVLVDVEIQGKEVLVYLGIGVDLNNGQEWNREMKKIATSFILETGRSISIDRFLLTLLQSVDASYANLQKDSINKA